MRITWDPVVTPYCYQHPFRRLLVVEGVLSLPNRLIETGRVTAQVVLVNDANWWYAPRACGHPLSNASSLVGKICHDRQGDCCPFINAESKASHRMRYAIGVIVANNVWRSSGNVWQRYHHHHPGSYDIAGDANTIKQTCPV